MLDYYLKLELAIFTLAHIMCECMRIEYTSDCIRAYAHTNSHFANAHITTPLLLLLIKIYDDRVCLCVCARLCYILSICVTYKIIISRARDEEVKVIVKQKCVPSAMFLYARAGSGTVFHQLLNKIPNTHLLVNSATIRFLLPGWCLL